MIVTYKFPLPSGATVETDRMRRSLDAAVARLLDTVPQPFPTLTDALPSSAMSKPIAELNHPIRGTDTAATASASSILMAAARHMSNRAAQYDQPGGERSMGRAVTALNVILGREAITESEGWLLLQLLKDVRDRQTPQKPHPDSLEDSAAYAALKAEARLAGR